MISGVLKSATLGLPEGLSENLRQPFDHTISLRKLAMSRDDTFEQAKVCRLWSIVSFGLPELSRIGCLQQFT